MNGAVTELLYLHFMILTLKEFKNEHKQDFRSGICSL